MARGTCLIVVIVLLSAPLASGQIMESEHLVPVIARTAGAGNPPTSWLTDLALTNPSDQPVTVGLMFFPWGADRITDWDFSFPVTIELAAQETRLVEDVLGTLFGYTGDTKGTLMVSCADDVFPTNPPDGKMLVATRTYNTGGGSGTFGQTVLPMDLYRNATFEPSYVLGARHDSRFRSNLGVMNLSPEPITVHFRIRGADGTVLRQGSRHLELFDGGQWSFGQLGLPRTDGALRVDVWLDPADVTLDPCSADWINAFVAYVSKVDGNPTGTGDAEFLPAIPDDFPPADWACSD